MKVLLLFPEGASITKAFISGFRKNGIDVSNLDFPGLVNPVLRKLDFRAGFMPGKIRNRIRSRFLDKINSRYIKQIIRDRPDLVFVYNDRMVKAGTVRELKQAGIKFASFLADTPFMLHRREHITELLFEMDYIFSPDSFRIDQLKMLGISKIGFLLPGFDEKTFFQINPTKDQLSRFGTDLVYLGSTYNGTWGYKRALFLSKFCTLNFRFYGPESWSKWFGEFPGLKENFVRLRERINDEELNLIMNCCKIYPVDANPAIFHGIHIRVLDCLGSGILPVIEAKKDLHLVFHGIDLPLINNYNEAEEIARYYLDNEDVRIELLAKMRKRVMQDYMPQHAAEQIIKLLFN